MKNKVSNIAQILIAIILGCGVASLLWLGISMTYFVVTEQHSMYTLGQNSLTKVTSTLFATAWVASVYLAACIYGVICIFKFIVSKLSKIL